MAEVEIPQRSSLLPYRRVLFSVGITEGRTVNRRSFVTLLGGAAGAWPTQTLSQYD